MRKVQVERRRQIMEALHGCLLKKPFDRTSIKEIAAAAGINHGMLHYYFKSKEDILLHYIEYVIEQYQSLFNDWMHSKGPAMESPEEFLRASFDFMSDKITLNRDLSKIFIEIWEIAIYNGKVREKLRKAYAEWIGTVDRIIVEVSPDGAAPSRLSIAIIAFLEGISLFSVILEKETVEAEVLLKEFQEHFLKFLKARW